MLSSFWNKVGIYFGTPSYSAKCIARQDDIEYTKHLIRQFELLSDWEEKCDNSRIWTTASSSPPRSDEPRYKEKLQIPRNR